MQTVNTFYEITVDISEELIKNYQQDLTGFCSLAHKLDVFAKLDSIYLRNFLRYHKYKNIYGSIRMLEAHGNSTTPKGFMYADLVNEKLVWHPVNDWLKQYEGKSDILYISCCNEGKIELPPKTSTIIYPLGRHNGHSLILENIAQSENNLMLVPSTITDIL